MDIKETKEVVGGVLAVALVVAERLKDGVGVDDAVAIVAKITSDEEFKAKMEEAFKGVEQIPAELKDLSAAEGIELGIEVLKFVPDLIAVLKK